MFGAPLFIGLGGLAVLFFWNDAVPIAAIPVEMYRIVVSPTLPTIPLFTLAGYILAESGASKRMIEVFRHWFGWMPGGTPVMVTVLCGFFTTLTGGSGVTILALGGLLLPMLRAENYSMRFSIGLITVSGSLGLLFPPSLPAIIYGVTAGVAITKSFWRVFYRGRFWWLSWRPGASGKDLNPVLSVSLLRPESLCSAVAGEVGSGDSVYDPCRYIWRIYDAG